MAEMMNGFNFGTTMKKIFFALIALAALVGCNTNVMEEVATTPQYLTTSFEVDLDGDTRAFDGDLNWSWESTDEIAAFQFAGEQTVNKLTLKENGKFGTEEFKYATTDSSTFVFVYPFAAYDAETQDVGYVQTGVWTPTLVGIVENATVNSIGSVEMTHMSAAFEIRVWDEGRQARKTISAATITSTDDFCDDTTATVEGLNTDTVVFNIAEGDFAFNLILTATDGSTYTVAVPAKNFVNGKRTILNVEWKYPPTASYTVYSSYNSNDGSVSKNNGVDGRSIYVKNVAIQHYVSDAATLTLKRTYNGSALDDVALTVGQEWSANSLALGTYTFQLVLTDGDYTWSTPVSSIYVTGLPYTLNIKANDSWNPWKEEGYVNWDTSSAVRLGYYQWGDAAYIQKSFYLPADTGVKINSTGTVCGSGSWIKVNTTFTISVSGKDAYSVKSTNGNSTQNYTASNKTATMTSGNPTVKCNSSYNLEQACVHIKSLTIQYQ